MRSARSYRWVTKMDPNAGLGQRADDLAGDLGDIARSVRGDANDSLQSSRQPAVISQAMALIRSSSSSSFPFSIVASSSRLKCVKIPDADAGVERFRRREHPGLHHQLRQADAAQERRLPAVVRARDHDQLPAVRVHVVPDRPGIRQGSAPG